MNKESTSYETCSSSNGGSSLTCEAKLCMSCFHFNTMVSINLIGPPQRYNWKSLFEKCLDKTGDFKLGYPPVNQIHVIES